jgi:hypothetical protein
MRKERARENEKKEKIRKTERAVKKEDEKE